MIAGRCPSPIEFGAPLYVSKRIDSDSCGWGWPEQPSVPFILVWGPHPLVLRLTPGSALRIAPGELRGPYWGSDLRHPCARSTFSLLCVLTQPPSVPF